MADTPESARGDRKLELVKLPPHSVEAEQAVLGGLLIDPAAWERIADVVTESDFYRDDHRKVFRQIARLVERAHPTDALTVAEALENNNELARIGGLAYLDGLVRSTPSAANIRRYAEIIRERSILRALAETGVDIADSAYNLTALLARGDPWPDNPRLSLRYYARQLHSLHRVTSLWEARAARYSWVLYLRPDLRFLSDLDLPRLRAFLHHAPDQEAIATPGFAKWGGLNDRLAFGPPSAMLAYGRRGEALERYVAVTQRRPCAEAYLAHYLAGHGVTAVDSEVRFQRIRADGRPDRRDAWLAAGPSGAPAPQPPESLMPVAHCQ